MRKFQTGSGKGFVCYDEQVIVLDSRGFLFYCHENRYGEQLHFNLPAGSYSSANHLIEAPVKKYRSLQLPVFEKSCHAGNRVEVISEKNSLHKCSVEFHPGVTKIFCDEKILTGARLFEAFIFGHELYHCKYYTEEYCDLGSADIMLKNFFNPSQCILAVSMSMMYGRDDLDKRKDYVITEIKKAFPQWE